MLRWCGWLVLATLIVAAAYELALALGAGTTGPEPGEAVTGSGAVQVIAFLSMIAASVLSLFYRTPPWPAALFAPAAAAFLVAFYFTYDPYYAPTLRRYSEGNVGAAWIAVVASVALADGVLTRLQPRIGRVMTSVVVLGVLLTTVFSGDGH